MIDGDGVEYTAEELETFSLKLIRISSRMIQLDDETGDGTVYAIQAATYALLAISERMK